MPDGATLKINGFEAIVNDIDLLGYTMGDPSGATEVAGSVMTEIAAESFATATDPVSGAPWEANSPATLAGRRGGGGGGKPLRDTGSLFNSILAMVPTLVSSGKAEITPAGGGRSGKIGNAELASIHNGSATGVNPDLVVRPINGEYLTIPVSPLARRYGSVDEFKVRQRSLNPFWQGKRLVTKDRRGNLTPHWVLTKEVRIPRRRFIGFSPAIAERVAGTVLDYLMEVLDSGNAGTATI